MNCQLTKFYIKCCCNPVLFCRTLLRYAITSNNSLAFDDPSRNSEHHHATLLNPFQHAQIIHNFLSNIVS